MKILISGFCPFAGFKENITQKLLTDLPKIINENEIYKAVLDVTYQTAFNTLDKEIVRINPDIVIATGMAASRKYISIEKIALNIASSALADNSGTILKDSVIVKGADVALMATLEYPNSIYENQMIANSYSAGTYVCNDIFYRLLERSTRTAYPYISFLHFPSEENIPYEKQLSIFINILSCL